MKPLCLLASLLVVVGAVTPFLAHDRKADDAKDDGFVPMFNGKDLTGWVNVNCAPSTFFVKDGEIITTGKPTGYLRTAKQYENFIADFEWMHVNKTEVGNSGFFVWADPLPGVGTPYTRGIEVQVLVNLTYKDKKTGEITATSQGDLFSIHGATCKPDRPHPLGWLRCLPSENRAKGGGEWNHYIVVAKDGVIKLHVNGKEVSGLSECKPRKGYLALESEGAECHFRNLKIKELPSSHPKADETADMAQDFKQLFIGLDLTGWNAYDETKKHWQPRDWMLHYDGKAAKADLATEKQYSDAEFITDFRFPNKDTAPCTFILRESKQGALTLKLAPDGAVTWEATVKGAPSGAGTRFSHLKPTGQWNRLRITLRGDKLSPTINGKEVHGASLDWIPEKLRADLLSRGVFALRPESEMEFGNLFVHELK
jgi:hypothetical protein